MCLTYFKIINQANSLLNKICSILLPWQIYFIITRFWNLAVEWESQPIPCPLPILQCTHITPQTASQSSAHLFPHPQLCAGHERSPWVTGTGILGLRWSEQGLGAGLELRVNTFSRPCPSFTPRGEVRPEQGPLECEAKVPSYLDLGGGAGWVDKQGEPLMRHT